MELGIQEMKGVDSTEEWQQPCTRVVQKMFDRVHRQAGPGPWIMALMMQAVSMTIQECTDIT